MEIDSITLPTSDGQRTVLQEHMAIVLPIEIGIMYTKSKDGRENFAVSEGLFTFEDNQGTLLVSTIESEEEIDFHRAEQARIRAEKRLNEKKEYEDGLDLKRAQLALMRSLSRLRLKK